MSEPWGDLDRHYTYRIDTPVKRTAHLSSTARLRALDMLMAAVAAVTEAVVVTDELLEDMHATGKAYKVIHAINWANWELVRAERIEYVRTHFLMCKGNAYEKCLCAPYPRLAQMSNPSRCYECKKAIDPSQLAK